MNMTDEDDRNNLRYAEYALGVLDADARAAVAQEIANNDEAATAVALWQRHFNTLAHEIPEAAPPAHVWTRVRQALHFDTPSTVTPQLSFWENLRLWRWIGISASAIAIVCLVMIAKLSPHTSSNVIGTSMMISSIKQDDGIAGWTATMDLERKQIVVIPATPSAIASNRNTELWLIPKGQKPIAVGVFTPDATTTLTLTPALLSQLGPDAILAVSVEPVGGSPTGQPTGPVIAKGAISGTPSINNNNVSNDNRDNNGESVAHFSIKMHKQGRDA